GPRPAASSSSWSSGSAAEDVRWCGDAPPYRLRSRPCPRGGPPCARHTRRPGARDGLAASVWHAHPPVLAHERHYEGTRCRGQPTPPPGRPDGTRCSAPSPRTAGDARWPARPMRVAHLAPGVLAVLIVLGALAGGVLRARQMEAGAARALAPTLLPQKRLGSALQQAALGQPDLLPIYGSSELRRGGKERPAAVFRDEPTGFQVFQVGNGGESALNHLLELSALGDQLQGKKVVISFTPGPLLRDRDWRLYFRDNFAPLHAYELVFTSDVDPEIKRSVARRLLEFPKTLAGDPLLGFAVTHLAGDRLEDRVLYALARPLGVIETFILRLQDHWALLSYLRRHPNLLFRQPSIPE